MAKVVLFFSMSLDGYVAGPEVGAADPMGKGGERLHDWMFKETAGREADKAVVSESFATTGAVVLGHTTFTLGLAPWGDTPYPVPSFVVTHTPRPPLPMKSAAFTFVTDGIASAVRQAQATAGERNVVVMGANTAQQVLQAGLADEIFITLVPVLLGGGARLFAEPLEAQVELQIASVAQSPVATHMRFTVDRA